MPPLHHLGTATNVYVVRVTYRKQLSHRIKAAGGLLRCTRHLRDVVPPMCCASKPVTEAEASMCELCVWGCRRQCAATSHACSAVKLKPIAGGQT